MKYVKLLFFFLLSVAAVTAVLSLLLPVSQKVEKSITIKAPASLIYRQLSKLENFNSWAIWSQRDSSVKYTLKGTDGTVGASTSWTGDPEKSGDGLLKITSLEENKKVGHYIQFSKPKKRTAFSSFSLNEINGTTTVTWTFEMDTPRPWNIFNLFYNLDKQMGKDFEDGLAALKTVTEKMAGVAPAKNYTVKPMNFPATSFAVVRQRIKWSDIPAFFEQHLPILYTEAQKASVKPGTAAGLYYEWDEKNQEADMAAAIPVSANMKTDNSIVQVISVSSSKAVFVDYYGDPARSMDAYTSIDKYLAENKLKQKSPVIERFVTDRAAEKDTSKWLTKIIMLVE